MPITIGINSYRLPSLTPDEFRVQYETKLAPMIKERLVGAAAPISYRRNYLTHDSAGRPVTLRGNGDKADWDAFIEVTFKDKEHFQTYLAAHEAHREAILAVEDEFVDREKVLVAIYETEDS